MTLKLTYKPKVKKYLYADVVDGSNDTVVVFSSGFSGSKNMPFIKTMANKFNKKDYTTVCINFCNDSSDKVKQNDAYETKDMNFTLYNTGLKNVMDSLQCNYKNIVFIGHSFGTPVFLNFLNKNKKFLNKIKLVLWEPSLLPWPKKIMEVEFPFDVKTGLHTCKPAKESLNKVFYKEVTSIDTAKLLQGLNKLVCIISAKGSTDSFAKKYFSKLGKNKKMSKNIVLENTDHFFKGTEIRKVLFNETLEYIK